MIPFLFLFSVFISIAYAVLIMRYLEGWNDTHEYSNISKDSSTFVSIILPVYNESSTIAKTIKAILDSSYPKHLFELIVVDNGSTDNSYDIISSIVSENLLVLQEPQGFKKEALEKGLDHSTGDFILLTDSDSYVHENWIHSMVFHYEVHAAEMVLGPVEIHRYNNLLTRFQAFDMLAMMGITAGGLKQGLSYLSNGANMAFTKSIYNKIGSIPRKDIPSGDDIFLLHAYIQQGGTKLYYQRAIEASVRTTAQPTWKELINQRIRWASKTTSYISTKDRNAAAFIFLFCLLILINVLLTPFTNGVTFFIALFQLFIKGTIDFGFITRINAFFKKKHLMKYFIPSFFVHFVYILFVGFAGLIRLKYSWRGKTPLNS